MWHIADGMGWWMLWGGLMMALFWGALIFLIVWAVQTIAGPEKRHQQSSASGPPMRTPLDIAGERYARGDISRKEFEQIRRDLSGL